MPNLKLVIGNRNYSSWSLRAWLALKATKAQFEEVVVPLDRPETRSEIARYSPSGKVPLLLDGEFAIWDSLAIGEYLAEKFPTAGLWPEKLEMRARARSVVCEMHSGFAELRRNMPMDLVRRHPGRGMTPEVARDIKRILDIWEECRRYGASDGEFLFGAFSLADAFFAPVVSRFVTYEVDLSGWAVDYRDAVMAYPAMREWQAGAASEPWIIEYH